VFEVRPGALHVRAPGTSTKRRTEMRKLRRGPPCEQHELPRLQRQDNLSSDSEVRNINNKKFVPVPQPTTNPWNKNSGNPKNNVTTKTTSPIIRTRIK
jgi:hypothetical protein